MYFLKELRDSFSDIINEDYEEELKSAFADLQLGQTSFQNKYFVLIRNGITSYGQYKQVLRELYTRYRGLRDLSFKIDKLKVQIRILKKEYINEVDFDKKELKQIELEEKKAQLEDYFRTYNQVQKEFIDFYSEFKRLKNNFDNLNDDEKEKLELKFWIEKITLDAILDRRTNGNISRSTMEMIMCLPTDIQKNILDNITSAIQINNKSNRKLKE